MGNVPSERPMIENEVVFRRRNESVQENFDDMRQIAVETNQEYLVKPDDTTLHFYCECSDENCQIRIKIRPSIYAKIHKNRNHFVLLGGHETGIIERVIRKETSYWVVEKFIKPPESVRSLQPTGVHNV